MRPFSLRIVECRIVPIYLPGLVSLKYEIVLSILVHMRIG